MEEAIAIENANPYGNAAAIYTMSGQTALETEPGIGKGTGFAIAQIVANMIPQGSLLQL